MKTTLAEMFLAIEKRRSGETIEDCVRRVRLAEKLKNEAAECIEWIDSLYGIPNAGEVLAMYSSRLSGIVERINELD